MNREETERLAEYIKRDGTEVVEVLGIEPLGPVVAERFAIDFFVKCAYKRNGLVFVVKSYAQWESRKVPPSWL